MNKSIFLPETSTKIMEQQINKNNNFTYSKIYKIFYLIT